jgi:hypothetical protein
MIRLSKFNNVIAVEEIVGATFAMKAGYPTAPVEFSI